MGKKVLHIGEKIALIRDLRGMTQQDLADKIFRERQTVTAIESKSSIDYALLLEILKVLDVTLQRFENLNIDEMIAGEPDESYKIQLDFLKQENEKLSRELEMFKSLVSSLNKTIESLNDKKN